ncbi:MAG: SDR family NAD(P)-dependent oxidoreductase [Candidatus Eisenbacteria bacterium]|uniref:SDR family NAD(P)-dependent oxidoreductase n=1 Tax=Eiseniibacteriota bacterium TaxID=2212470 RepID=A0A538TPC7_UNCEI|nr:MAG: SDR family NAD(P)-dependent oxidoreductase [Candidatus Eisenbacteria bacterium]
MSRENPLDLEVAIIGMAGRFPGADSIEAFWRNLRAGVESIRDLSDDELRAAGVDPATLADPRLVRRAADLRGADRFDAALFGFTPREAELMDPQFRVFLEDSWTALENAGYLSDRHDVRVGVFAGAGPNTYLLNNVYSNPQAAQTLGAFQTSIGNERDYLATHVSYRLDLRGPSLVVQTACSTSLVAIHLACQSLLNHECDIALAGGVSISVPQTAGYLYEEGGIASPDGHCRAFDEAATGCVKGNGSGIVVLKRLAEALRDGDTLRAVIKGSAVNNDGSLKLGFTAPSDAGQAGVITEALSVAGADAASVTYVEAHGTGTTLGDPVEVAALARAFGAPAGRIGRCALGSVKTNVGHLDAAAGVAGLIKTVLSLEHREIPPSLHFRRPNPKIDFAATPFYVNADLRDWPGDGTPRRAGVSSFGIGGTNAHLILEEPPASAPSGRARPAQVFVLSAATESALSAASESLAALLESGASPNLADAAYTLQVGRKRLPWRRAVTGRDTAEVIAALRQGPHSSRARHDLRRGAEIAFLFPGQGAQHPGMTAELYRHEAAFRDPFDRCADRLRPLLGLDLRRLVFAADEGWETAEARLRETSLSQPALFAVEFALARLWISWGVRPVAMAGHSIGEYVAACLAGVLSLEEALGLVAERGRLMGSLPRGAMLAVQATEADLAARLTGYPALSVAAINGPSSCVASGPEAEIGRLEAELAGTPTAHRRVHTSHAFHSAMMDPILGAFAERVRQTRLSAPSIPFLSNLTGTWITAEQATDPAYWVGHLRSAVRFADNLATLLTDPARVLLEVGPGTLLTSLARQQGSPDITLVASLRHPKQGGPEEVALLEALGKLWCAGIDIDWEAFHTGFGRRRVPLPTYPFERRRHWIEPGSGPGAAEATGVPAKEPDIARWFYAPGWKRSLTRGAAPEAEPPWLVFDDGSKLARAVVDLAVARGGSVTSVLAGAEFLHEGGERFRIDPRRREHYDRLLRELHETGRSPGRIVHLWCADGSRIDPASAQDVGFFSLLALFQAMGAVAAADDVRLAAVAGGLFDVVGEEVVRPERATLVGACRVASQEYPGLTCRLVDVGEADITLAARNIADELEADDGERVVAWRGGHRWVPAYQKIRLEPPSGGPPVVRAGGAFLLTGGTGPLELAIAERLAAAGAKGIAFIECDGGAEAAVAGLRDRGIEVLCSPALVTRREALAGAVAAAHTRFGRLDAIFHTAGAIGGGMIQLKEREAAERLLAPRLDGARLLAGQLEPGATLVLFSSAISATGVFGQVDFCAASAFLDAFAHSRRRSRRGSFSMTVRSSRAPSSTWPWRAGAPSRADRRGGRGALEGPRSGSSPGGRVDAGSRRTCGPGDFVLGGRVSRGGRPGDSAAGW